VTDLATLVRVSRLYYELGETQARVAELVGVTRPQVSRLLKEARSQGIVEIRIIDATEEASPAADELRTRFGLSSVHLAPSVDGPGATASVDGGPDLARRRVGRLAAQVLLGAVRDGQIVGIGDGAAVSATADALDPLPTPIDATVVPLCGGFWRSASGREPFRRVADAFGAGVRGLLAPGLLDDEATRNALRAHAGIREVLDLWDGLEVALFGIGGPSWSEAAVGPEMLREIASANAVGEVLIAPFDIWGRFVADGLRARTIAFDARALSRVPTTIGVAEGPAKVAPILGALRAGIVNTLVTDVRTAEAVLALDNAAPDTAAPDHGAPVTAAPG
jgi:DNA-binding transcriptional regulator LsrR (DeoR family)